MGHFESLIGAKRSIVLCTFIEKNWAGCYSEREPKMENGSHQNSRLRQGIDATRISRLTNRKQLSIGSLDVGEGRRSEQLGEGVYFKTREELLY